ncbi:hypothetical protein [Sphingobium sp. SYK-6]|uniref:hypothetical protein n=1 Tax=Sphingobium sp. (strain NBRC 103272 / SYK-6) TaxID=627192 RepID=UPI00059DF54E|nr:hypothetical protein [Sphingobium sp. SYK-6]
MDQVKLETLYFAECFQGGLINYWPASDKGGQELTVEGKSRADALVNAMRVSGHPIMLPFVADAISKAGDLGPMERAFFHRLGEHILP